MQWSSTFPEISEKKPAPLAKEVRAFLALGNWQTFGTQQKQIRSDRIPPFPPTKPHPKERSKAVGPFGINTYAIKNPWLKERFVIERRAQAERRKRALAERLMIIVKDDDG